MTSVSGLILSTAGTASGATPESEELVQHDLILDGNKRLARRALMLVPKKIPEHAKLPVLVLLHGLGETGNEKLGIHAWGERYGLVKAYERLRTPPIQRTLKKARYLTDEHRQSLNESLKKQPFQGVILVCPVTPNPYRLRPAHRTLDRYAEWIEQTLLPAVRKRAPALEGPASTGLDGCSLGGYVGIELFLRKPQLFGTFGGVQAAFSVPRAIKYAKRIATVFEQNRCRPIHIETSTQDPYRKANEALSRQLTKLGIPNQLSVLPGPHNQPWLREIGTLNMLLWHDRKLSRSSGHDQ